MRVNTQKEGIVETLLIGNIGPKHVMVYQNPGEANEYIRRIQQFK